MVGFTGLNDEQLLRFLLLNTKNMNDKEQMKIIERPRFFCIDLDNNIISALRKIGANIYEGSLGYKIKVPKPTNHSQHYLLLNHDFPQNIHEFDIIIIDLDKQETIDYKANQHKRELHTNKTAHYFKSSHPQTLFDPRPFACSLLKEELDSITKRKFLVIAFSSQSVSVEYEIIQLLDGYEHPHSNIAFDIYSFWKIFL